VATSPHKRPRIHEPHADTLPNQVDIGDGGINEQSASGMEDEGDGDEYSPEQLWAWYTKHNKKAQLTKKVKKDIEPAIDNFINA